MNHNERLDALVALEHHSGGWAYAPGQLPQPEPTCLALLALAGNRDRYQQSIVRGLNALAAFRGKDGSYRATHARPEAVWATALALVVLVEMQAGKKDIDATASFLLGVRGKPGQEDPETDSVFNIDIKLIGWPWAEGTFSWVEPTAWACLALQRAGQGSHPRVQEGLRLLLDRAFDTGGANYGNRMVLGKQTDPIPGPSAILLLALQHHKDNPKVIAAAEYLRKELLNSADPEHWGQIQVALHAIEESGPSSNEKPDFSESSERTIQRPARLAWAALGANVAAHNPLALADVPPQPPLPEKPMVVYKPGLGQRIKDRFSGLLARGISNLRQPINRSAVHLARAESYDDDLAAILRKQFEHFRELVPLAGRRVVLKPNLVEFHPNKVINTHPNVIGAMIALCQAEGAAEVIVAEGPGHWRNVEYLVAESGLGDVLAKYNVPFVDINHDEPVKLANLGHLTGLEYLFVAKTIATADVLISMPKLKTHHWAGCTLSLKNLFGVLPGTCYGWPKNELHWRGIAESIVDIALTCTPHLAVIDGIIGMEGDGPLNGTAKPMGTLIMGNDLVATDATACRLMGLPAERIVHIALAAHKRLGRIKADEIQQVGETIAGLKKDFELPPRFEKITLPETASTVN